MFGYVLIQEKGLTPEARARYQASYCGLCRRLGKLHGLLSRLTLSYDLTFLNVLLSSLYEDDPGACAGCGRCPAHPFRKRAWRASPATDYCADLSVALHYYSAEDKWRDDHSLFARLLMALLKPKLPAVERRCPRACAAIRRELAELSRLEAENVQDPDVASACFGRLMAELFDWKADRWSPELRAMGMALGQYIYLLDAADDLEKDRKKQRYNPLYRYSSTQGWQNALREGLENLMARCTSALRVLPCVADADILENILYAGVWLRWPFGGPGGAKSETPPAAAGEKPRGGAQNS